MRNALDCDLKRMQPVVIDGAVRGYVDNGSDWLSVYDPSGRFLVNYPASIPEGPADFLKGWKGSRWTDDTRPYMQV